MKKIASLIRASMTENMNLFKIKSKSSKSKIILPIILFIFVFMYMVGYSAMLMDPLREIHLEYVVLTLFIAFTTVMTLMEGVYKSSSLLFNTKDDNLLLALPIKKSTVLFVRIFKFYVFELLYNSLFLVPSMAVYATYVNVNSSFYLVSLIAVFLLPIIPIVISCIIGGIISYSSSKFKHKNFAQTIATILMLLLVFYAVFNLENFIGNIVQNAYSINEIITKIYYPAGAYINLVLNYSLKNLITFIIINLLILAISIFVLSKVYYKINSKVKVVKTGKQNNRYKIKKNNPIKALIKKEINRFINSPVFVVNTGFGLVLYLVVCIVMCIKFEGISNNIIQNLPITKDQMYKIIPAILFGCICISSLLSSITSSIISLEGKSFNILKSLPIKPFNIILAKVLTAVIIMIPFILIGDIVVFFKFDFELIQIVMILISTIILPFVAQLIGIIINLKYPKMDAENDTEVVKQSISSMIAVFIGMILSGLTVLGIGKCLEKGFYVDTIILVGIGIYTLIGICLVVYLKKVGIKDFNKINV